jgi:WD40 repeat protein
MRFMLPLLLALTIVDIVSAAAPPKPPRLDRHGDPLPAGAIARLGTVRFQFEKVEDSRSALERRFRAFHPAHPLTLAPDGSTVTTIFRNEKGGQRLVFMDTTTGKILRYVELADIRVEDIHFTPDGKGLVVTAGWHNFQLLDAQTGKVIRSVDVEKDEEVPVLALSPEGDRVATQSRKKVYHAPVKIWDLKTGKELATLPGRGALCSGLTFGGDGKRLLLRSMIPTEVRDGGMSYGGPDAQVALVCLDITARKIIGETTIRAAQESALCLDGETVAFENSDHQSTHVRHLPTSTERCVIRARLSRFRFMPDGKILFAVDDTGRAGFWDAMTGKKIRNLEGTVANKDFEIIGISKDGKTIAILDGGYRSEPVVVVWNAVTGKRMGHLPGHDGTVTGVAFTPDGKFLVSGSIDRTVRLWDTTTGEHLRILAEHTDSVTAVAISPDGKRAASSSESGALGVSTLADGKFTAASTGPDRGARALAFSPSGKELFAGGASPTVLTWSVTDGGKVTRRSLGEQGVVLAIGNGGSLALLAQDTQLNSDEMAERLHIWNPARKEPTVSISIRSDKPAQHVHCAAATFSPCARLLASSQVSEYWSIRRFFGGYQLRLWERISGEPIRTVAPAITEVLAFSPNGRLLASRGASSPEGRSMGGPDYGTGTDIWDTATGEKIATLPVTPTAIAFSPDGKRLATGSADHCVLIWEVAPRSPKKTKPTAAEWDAWWDALRGSAGDAYKAIGQMTDAPEAAVAQLNEHVCPVRLADPETVARLIARLDHEEFAERQKAQQALEKLGESAEAFLLKALQNSPSAESRRRMNEVVSKCRDTAPDNSNITAPSRLLNGSARRRRATCFVHWLRAPPRRDERSTHGPL